MVINLSIGIIAFNEARIIVSFLNSLMQQSLFGDFISDFNIEIIVVANGCVDDTATLANEALNRLVVHDLQGKVKWKIHEIEIPGKPNAWNSYVHDFSALEADYLILIDADIQFLNPQTLVSLVTTLQKEKDAWITVDNPVKDVFLKKNRNLSDQLLVLISSLSGRSNLAEGNAWICGQLYCGRAELLREIWLPIGVLDDSFIYKMIVSNGLISEDHYERVILAKEASYIFEAYINPFQLLNHEKFLIYGQTINNLFYEYFRNQKQLGLSAISRTVQDINSEDKQGLSHHIKFLIEEKGIWIIPKPILSRRFNGLKSKPIAKITYFLPLAIIAFLIDFILALQVNHAIRTWAAKSDYSGQ
jgi:glycosyltransferase involved in cell wall biosynthesis